MRGSMMVWLFWSSVALAQSPIQLGGPPASGPVNFVVAAVDSQRFEDDAEVPGPSLTVGEVVEVVFDGGEKVRIKRGIEFGWVPAEALAATPPVAEAEPEAPVEPE